MIKDVCNNLLLLVVSIFICVCYAYGAGEDSPEILVATPQQKAKIKELIEQLADKNWDKKQKAQKALVEIGELAENDLKEAAQSTDIDINFRAKKILSIIDFKRNAKFSDGLLKEYPDFYYEFCMRNTCNQFMLFQEMTSVNSKYKLTMKDIELIIKEIMAGGIHLLGSSQKNSLINWCAQFPSTVPYIVKLWEDNDNEVRVSAITSILQLAKKPDVGVKPSFKVNEEIKSSAIAALDKLNINDIMSELLKFSEDKSPFIRTNVAISLSRLGGKDATIKIIALLKDKNELVRERAVIAVAEIAAKEAIPQMMELLKDESELVRYATIKALAYLDAKESISELTALLKDSCIECQIAAIDAVSKLGGGKVIPIIMEVLQDKDSEVRGWAAITLVELGAKDCIPKEVINDVEFISQKLGKDNKLRVTNALEQLEKSIGDK